MKRICIVDSVYSLFLYFLIKGVKKDDIFICSTGVPYHVRNSLKSLFYSPTVSSNKKKVNILKLRIFIFLKTIFNRVEVYGNDHLVFSFPFFEYKNSFVIEEGLGNYADNNPINKKISFFQRKKKEFFGDHDQWNWRHGRHSNVKKIYLTGISQIPKNIESKAEIVNLNRLWNDKSVLEKKKILDIFEINEKTLNMITEESILFFTQPLSEDNRVTIKEEIDIYRKALKHYDSNQVIIKKHPREEKNYSEFFPNINVIEGKFPAELIKLLGIRVKKVSTIFSTAVFIFDEDNIDFFGTQMHPKLVERFGKRSKESILSNIKNNG